MQKGLVLRWILRKHIIKSIGGSSCRKGFGDRWNELEDVPLLFPLLLMVSLKNGLEGSMV